MQAPSAAGHHFKDPVVFQLLLQGRDLLPHARQLSVTEYS